MKIKNKENFIKTFDKFLKLDTPILIHGPFIPCDLFDILLKKDSYIYIDTREIESVTLIDLDKIFNDKIVVFANINYNKSFVSFLKGLKRSFIATSNTFLNFGIPLLVEYEIKKKEFSLVEKISDFYLKENYNINFYNKHKMLEKRFENLEILNLENRILIYNTFKGLFGLDISKEVYLTEEMIYNFKKEKVNHLLHYNYFFSTENLQILFDILENIKFKENLILFGDTGTGKTSLIEFLAKQLKKELFIVNISNDTEISDFVGKFVLQEKKLVFKEGYFLKALKKDCWLLLDEVNLAPQEVLDFLESCVTKRSVFVNNEVCEFHSNFLIFCCMNLNDVGKKNFDSSIFIKKELKNSPEDFIGLNEKYNPNDNRNLSLPITNKREYVRALKLLRNKYELDFVFKLLYNQNILQKKRIKNEILLTDYVITEENESIVERVEMAIEIGLPVLLQGDTSTGKTSLITALAKKYNKKLYRINNHEQTEASDYFGDGTDSNEGIMNQAIKNGDWILLDELNLAPSDVLEVLNRILETSYKEFRLFSTQNLNYSGRKPLSKAFLSRFIVVDFSVKSSDELKKILSFKYPNQFNHKIVKIYDELKLQRNFNELITLRDCFRWSKRIINEKDFIIKGLMVIYERQRGKDRKIIQKYFSEHFENYKKYFLEKQKELKLQNNTFVLNFSFTKLICLILDAWKYKEPVLLVGETGIGKSKAIEMACTIFNRPFITVSLSGNTDPSDFIGSFSISKNELIWTDGPLTKAMKEGKILILDEINLAENSVLERLNSVLEDERTLFITEKNEMIKAHDDFLVISSMNPSTDIGKRELSPALRNRFTEIFFELTDDEKNEIGCKMLNNFYNFSNISLRKVELMRDYFENIHLKYFKNSKKFDLVDVEKIEKKDYKIINDEFFGIEPFIHKIKEKTDFDFTSLSVKSNLFSLLRALELKRPILLEGDCGTGKTSLIVELAKILGKKIYKINLCESTEMCDLIGQFTPTQNGIVFKEGIISVLKKGDWLLLDEINLCSQSVLEGLNSLLDYRRSFYSTYLSFVMHEESRIFGTMNESNFKNKRNLLPRSFIDRFIKLKFSLTENDIKKIIENKNMIYYKDKGLRYNLLANKIKKNYSEKNEISYSLKSDKIIFNNESENELVIESSVIKNGYTLIHSQLNDLDTFLRCKKTNTPVLLMGKARDNFLKIIYDFCEIHCHEEMDISDLIGQFVKENNNFVWKDSPLIQSIKNKKTIYINSANLVEKTVLDRINSLLEGKIELFEHDNEILKNESFIILGSDEELSPAIMDRCVIIKPSLTLNHIDIFKIFSQNCFYQEILPENNSQCYLQEIKKIINFTNLLNNTKFFTNSLEESYDLIYLDKLKYEYLNEIPFYLKNTLPFLTDDQLFKLFSFTKLEEEIFNDELLEFYLKNCYFFKDTFEDNLSNLQALITENSDEFKLINFIKRISNCDFIKLEEFPYGIKELKKLIIKLDIKELKNVLLDINYEINFEFNKKFNELIKLGIDPLVLKKKKLINKIKKYFNNNSEKLTNHFVNLYKYGKSNFDITFFTNKMNQIQEEISEIKERNYSEFIKNIYDYNLLYQNSEFDDILNYYKVSLVKKIPLSINECNPCVYFNNHFNCKNYNYFISPFSLFYQIKNNKKEINNLIRQLNFNDLINELSKYFINLLINKPTDDKSLIIELIKNNKLMRSKIKLEEKELSNDLLNELLIYKYNKENKEMKYFLLLFFYEMNYEECQKYFLDCFVFQFKERVYFTKEYFNILMNNEFIKNISDSFTNPVLLYNTALLYSVLINKEKGNVHMLSLINNLPIKKYENIKGCLCSHSKLKKYYKKIKSEKFIFKDICFCKKEYKKINLNLNEIYFEREPLKIFSKEEKLIGYLMWKVKDSNEKERNMVLGVVLEPSLDILEKVVMYFYRKEKIIEEKVSGDEMDEDVKENQDDRLSDEENEKSNEESNENSFENEESDNSILEKEKENISEENNNLSNFEEENDIFSNFENEEFSENESEEINDKFNEEEINLSSEEKNEEEKSEEEKSEEEKSEEDKSEGEKSEECNDSFSNYDFEKDLSKEVEKEEYSSISDNFEMNNIESMTEKKNDELLEDNLLNENLTDDLLINDLQNKEINLEINNEQTCKEAQNYLTKVEEEKIKEINKEDFFIVLKNNLPDNKKNKFKGDFKSGKKINMKRIVGYFMSDFQKDKIFLRRIKESKKEYIINIYIDNSKSMLKYNLKKKLIYLFDLLKYSFDKLNLQFNLFSFGEETKEINELNLLFNEERSNIIFKEGYNIVLTDGIINQMVNHNTLYLFLNNELRNMKQVICDNGIRVVNYLEMMNVKYCLVDDDNFIEEFGKGLAELIKE